MSVYDLLHESADKAVYKCVKFGLPLNTQLRLLKSCLDYQLFMSTRQA